MINELPDFSEKTCVQHGGSEMAPDLSKHPKLAAMPWILAPERCSVQCFTPFLFLQHGNFMQFFWGSTRVYPVAGQLPIARFGANIPVNLPSPSRSWAASLSCRSTGGDVKGQC